MTRRDLFKGAAFAAPALAQPAFQRMNVGCAHVDVTPDRPRYCASGDRPDPPRSYAPLISRCMTLFDGQRRMAIVNYPFNCLDVATPILRERCEREIGIPPEYLVLLATHNMAEVERLCSDVLMLKRGRIVDRGSPQELLDRYGREDMEEVFLDIARDRRRAAAGASA